MSCCQTIQSQLKDVSAARSTLKSCRSEIKKVLAVHQALDVFRRVFGSYRVDTALTQTFRREVEPSLEKVWTREDLDNFTQKLDGFSQKVEGALEKWRGKYCKERVAAATS